MTDSGSEPAMVYARVADTGIRDRRTEFRHTFCAIEQQCEEWLRSFGDAPDSNASAAPPASPTVQIVIVTGIFGECLPEVPAFGDAVPRLRALGYAVSYAPVLGRGSSELNAAIIADHIRSLPAGSPRVAILGYSKGVSDSMEALAAYPGIVPRIAALAGFAGVVNGTPLADQLRPLYEQLFSPLQLSRCARHDEQEMKSLTREYRLSWLAAHTLPPTVSYYSFAAVPDVRHVSLAFQPFHARLSQAGPRNDGQVIYSDAILPGSSLLAYVNADHFGIALPFQTHAPLLAKTLVTRNALPRTALLEALMRTIERDLVRTRP